jgi:hypothetical protein
MSLLKPKIFFTVAIPEFKNSRFSTQQEEEEDVSSGRWEGTEK